MVGALLLGAAVTASLWALQSGGAAGEPGVPETERLAMAVALSEGDLELGPIPRGKVPTPDPRQADRLLAQSAAYAQSALGGGPASSWIWALELADQAVQADPTRHDARYQRALCLEHLSLFQAAREARRDLDPAGGTGGEEASAPPEPDRWETHLRRFATAFAGTAEARRHALFLLERFPQHARLFVEGELFRRWATAELADDPDLAARTLAELTLWGDVLAEAHGDRFIAEAVGVLRTARSGRERALLAAGHRALGAGLAHYARSDCRAARPDLERAARELRRAASPAADLAELHRALCEPDGLASPAAAAQLARLRDELGPHPYPYLRARVLGNLGLHFLKGRQLSQALETYEAAIEEAGRAGEPAYASYLHTNLARLWSQLGQEERAWRHRLQALARTPQFADPRRVFTVLMAAARAADRMGAPHAALEIADELLARLPPEDELPDLWAETLLRRSQLSQQRHRAAGYGDLQRASAHLGEVADSDLAWRIRADLRIAEAELRGAGDSAAARERLSEAIRYFEAHSPALELAALYRARALAELRAGEVEPARRDLHRALEQIEEQRSLLLDDDQRLSYFDTARTVFEEAITLEQRYGADSERAFLLSEQMRARLLLDSLARSQEDHPAEPVDLASVAAAVPPGTAVLEMTVLPDRVLVWVIRHRTWELCEQPIEASELRSQVSGFRSKIARAAPTAEIHRRSQELYKALFAAPLRRLQGEDRLIVVADDVLFRLPLNALRNPRTGRYLLQDFTVVAAPSAAVYLHSLDGRLRSVPAEKWQALVVGNPDFDAQLFPALSPLPGAAEEARQIAALYGVHPLLVGEATRARLLAALPQVDLLHYAGHSVRDSRRPDQQSLLLAPDGGEPGLVSAQEIAQLSLRRPRLVVLASCATSGGLLTRSEGPLSLARAFLASGVPAVVATLWPIEDGSSARVFPRFHQHLKGGEEAASALRSTLLRINDEGGPGAWDDVRAWGSYQIIGS